MWPLPELQARFAGAILAGELALVAPAIAEDSGSAAEARLRVYRNHVRITLAEALGATFPATRRLLGEPCFEGLARRFVVAHPPAEPCLAAYGGRLPAFLGRQPELASVPCAAALARLEWALHRAQEAADEPAFTPRQLARLAPEAVGGLRLGLHPAWRVLRTRWPVLRLWAACQPDAARDEAPLPLVPAFAELLVGRDAEGDPVTAPLSPGQSLFLRALAIGCPLGRAAAAARQREPGFDLAGTLAWCLEGGVLAAPSTPLRPNRRGDPP